MRDIFRPSPKRLSRRFRDAASRRLRTALCALLSAALLLAALAGAEAKKEVAFNLKGLEHFAGLFKVDAGFNAIADLSPLTGLPSLQWLDLTDNPIEDMGPLDALAPNLNRQNQDACRKPPPRSAPHGGGAGILPKNGACVRMLKAHGPRKGLWMARQRADFFESENLPAAGKQKAGRHAPGQVLSRND